MIRNFIIALGATAVVAAAALSPTAASAHGWHGPHGHHGHHGHHGWHRGFGFGIGLLAPAYYAGSNCYLVRRVVMTPYGERVRRVTVCD